MNLNFKKTIIGLLVIAALILVPKGPRILSLIRANMNTDLRDRLITPSDVIEHFDDTEMAKQSSVVKTDGPYKLWTTPIGEFWMPENETVSTVGEMAEIIEGNGTYYFKGRTVRPGDVVIDCGAHLGSFIRKSLQLGASLVIGIEPSSVKVESMRRTFEKEIAAGKVRILQLAVWDKDDKLWLPGPANMANSLIDQSDEKRKEAGEWVKVTTLDKIIAAEKLEKLDFLKMDIEGAETNALKGSVESIKKWRPFLGIAVEHTDDLTQNARNVLKVVEDMNLGYNHGFGRYGKLTSFKAYTPFEIFFFQEKL